MLPMPQKMVEADLKNHYQAVVNKTLRPDADDTLKQMLKMAAALIVAPGEELVKSCLSCDSFNEQTETCLKADHKRPPARIIAFGCESYTDKDFIPF